MKRKVLRYGCLWISTNEKLSSHLRTSNSKTPSNAKKDQNLTLNRETKIAVMKFTNEIRIKRGLPACRTIEK